MKIHVRGWHFQMTRELHIYKIFIHIFVKLWFWAIFYTIHDEKCSFLHLVQQELNVAHQTSNCGQGSCCRLLDKNSYPEETELDTNPSLTLAQTLTLSIVSAVLAILLPIVVTTARFLIMFAWIHHTLWGGIQSLDQTSISDENSQLHEIDA